MGVCMYVLTCGVEWSGGACMHASKHACWYIAYGRVRSCVHVCIDMNMQVVSVYV